MRNSQLGFSLLELMIVVAIIAVLSAAAVPQYQEYLMRAKWSANLGQVEPLKLAIADCLSAAGEDLAACDTASELGLATLPKAPYRAVAADTVSLDYTAASKTLSIGIIGNTAAGGCKVTVDGVFTDGLLTWTARNVANGGGTTCGVGRTGIRNPA